MLPRIGPKKELSAHRIEVVVNVVDHPTMPHLFCLRGDYALDRFIEYSGREEDESYSGRKNRVFGEEESSIRGGRIAYSGRMNRVFGQGG